MKRAALGVRMHSGWGVLVALAGDANSVEVLDRRRIVTMDPKIPGAFQPYHHSARLGLPESERHLANCAAASERVALAAVAEVVRELDRRQFQVTDAAVLLASGQPLPVLSKILASHALIHTAEGEFFRAAVRRAFESLGITVTAMPERALDKHAKAVLGNATSRVQRRIADLGRSLGPPWTKDHKSAALAAAIILARGREAGPGSA